VDAYRNRLQIMYKSVLNIPIKYVCKQAETHTVMILGRFLPRQVVKQTTKAIP